MGNANPGQMLTGITQQDATFGARGMGCPAPFLFHEYWEDFNKYVAADWTINNTDGGTDGAEVRAVSDADGGVFTLTTNDADDDNERFQYANENWKFETGKRLWFQARLKVDDATQSDFVIGLQITDTTPFDVTDGVFFQKDDGDTQLDIHIEKNNTATTVEGIHTMVDDTYVVMSFVYDGISAVSYYINGAKVNDAAVTNLPDDEELTVSFAIQAGEAAAKTLSIDYIYVCKER